MRCYGATDERGMLGTGHQPMERLMGQKAQRREKAR
jgi:hypothetical protein